MNKCVSAAEAVSAIESGMTIGIGGWGPRRKPMGLVRELLRSDVKDLTVVAYGGADVGLLCAAGKVKKSSLHSSRWILCRSNLRLEKRASRGRLKSVRSTRE